MGDEESGRADHRSESKHVIRCVECLPDYRREDDGNDRVEPDSFRMEEALSDESILLFFEEKPVEEEEYEEYASSDEEDRCAGFDNLTHFRIIAEGRSERSEESEAWRCEVDDEPRKESSDQEYGNEYPPDQEPSPVLRLHSGEDLCVDDGVIDAGYDFEQAKSEYDDERSTDAHAAWKIGCNSCRMII